MIPALFLPLAQFAQMFLWNKLAVFPFWIAALIYPVYLLVRNQRARNLVNRARRVLKNCGITMAEAVLFRCVPQELEELSRLKTRGELEEYVNKKGETELRWLVIGRRFIDPCFAEETANGQNQNK